jgi:peptide deformylase
MMQIVTYPDPVLRETAEPVGRIDQKILDLLDQMQESMYADDGVGLAAPQVGVSKRIIVVDGGEGLVNLINPEIISSNDETEGVEEGCLSLPGIRVTVTRPTEVTVTGMNEKGESVRYEASDLMARIFQHEIDHLNGTLIIDHLSTLQRGLLKSKLRQLEKHTV